MNKELYVSSTPHETKVAVVEDDQLAEIYFERENEYTLAGSIYKGRVTRVLPGMQSAFVDIGLERDAFLYVTDFLEEQGEEEGEFEELPVPPREERGRRPQEGEAAAPEEAEPAEQQPRAAEGANREDEDGSRRWRGRRGRRRGRGGRSLPESKFAHPQASEGEEAPREEAAAPVEEPQPENRATIDYQPMILPGESLAKFNRPAGAPREESRPMPFEREPRRESRDNRRGGRDRFDRGRGRDRNRDRGDRGERDRERGPEFTPPPGYQPIVLPGESISKYRRGGEQQSQPESHPAMSGENLAAEGAAAAQSMPPMVDTIEHEEMPAPEPERFQPEEEQPKEAHVRRITEDMNIAAIFGGTAAEPEEQSAARQAAEQQEAEHHKAEAQPAPEAHTEIQEPLEPEPHVTPFASRPGVIEEEEIDEEEAESGSIDEAIDDADFEELEEETLDASGNRQPDESNGQLTEAIEESEQEEAIEEDEEEAGGEGEEFEEPEEEEQPGVLAEGEQAEGEFAEEDVQDRAEVRAPAGTAGFQRAAEPRPGFDRQGRRGRRGGRRMRGGRRNIQARSAPLISDLLKEGQEILVQIAKEPIGKKGARITSHIALPGRFLVFMPTVNHVGVSRKISSDEERQRLKRILLSERQDGHGGFIVRTAASGASEDDLRADIRFLINLWNEIKARSESSQSPALIYHDLNLVERILRDQVTSNFSHIWVDSESEYERIVRFVGRFQPQLAKRVRLYTKETPLFEQFNIQEEINKSLKSKVWLKSGGYIVINQTEALVAIDVNTGKYVGKTARLEDTIVKTNVDAIKEIVRQVRLRDLGGIIVIDFIDMDERRNRQKVMQALEEALKADRAPSKVLQFNDFGLVAITRKRVKQSLERTLGTQCPYCTGTGMVKSVTTVCNEIWVEMKKMAKHLERGDVILRVHPEVAKALKGNNARWLTDMEELTGRTVIVKSDPTMHQEQFDFH